MKNYITYQAALELLDPDKQHFYGNQGEENKEIWLAGRLQSLSFVLINGQVWIEETSLLKRFESWKSRIGTNIQSLIHISSLAVSPAVAEYLKKTHLRSLTIDNIEIYDHTLDLEVLAESLKKDGPYPLLYCTCGDFGCGGIMIEVKKLRRSLVVWQPFDPIGPVNDQINQIYLGGKLEINGELHRNVLIPTPLYFEISELEKLVKSV